MSLVPKIESSDLTIESLFKDFYAVPDFQREYVWKPEHVRVLFEDIENELFDAHDQPLVEREYFIGSIVVCRDGQAIYQLIDGQQRLTTIYLFLCVLRDFMIRHGLTVQDSLKGMIGSPHTDDYGNEKFQYRLYLQYDDSRGVLETIAEGKVPLSEIKTETESIGNLLNAYVTLDEELTSWTGEKPERVKLMFATLAKRVKLIRIMTPNLAHALKVFETINDRGIGLNAMDLLKNLLFMRASAADHSVLKTKWKELVGLLEAAREKPLRFLRYFIMANFPEYKGQGTNKPVREDEIYAWMEKHKQAVGIANDPLGFVDLLITNARFYRDYAEDKGNDGQWNRYLNNIALMSGKARQHFILLLAGRQASYQGGFYKAHPAYRKPLLCLSHYPRANQELRDQVCRMVPAPACLQNARGYRCLYQQSHPRRAIYPGPALQLRLPGTGREQDPEIPAALHSGQADPIRERIRLGRASIAGTGYLSQRRSRCGAHTAEAIYRGYPCQLRSAGSI